MFNKTQLNKYADVLIWGLKTARKNRFKKNDIILLQFDRPALNLAEVLYERILLWGMNPIQRMIATFGMEYSFYSFSNNRQLIFQAPGDKELMEHLSGRIFLRAPESLTHLKDIDPTKIGKSLVSRKPLRDILEKREQKGLHGWTLCTYPTEELAKQAQTNMDEYKQQIIKACYLDKDNPVKEWDNILKNITAIKKWLNNLKVKYFHIESQHIDLKITPGEKRKWSGVSGHNIPSFEVFFSPDWRGTEGSYYANLPSFRSGNYVEEVRLLFKEGSVINAEAKTGEEFLKKQIAMDKGASKVGEFSLTDRRFSRIDMFMADTLFDENFGGDYGNSHIALGASYVDTYSGNPSDITKTFKKKMGFNDSALHWDLVNTEDKTVTAYQANGKKMVIYENGMFKY